MSTKEKEEEDVSTNNRVNPIPKGYDYVTPHLMVIDLLCQTTIPKLFTPY
jgi:hypothetical protein